MILTLKYKHFIFSYIGFEFQYQREDTKKLIINELA